MSTSPLHLSFPSLPLADLGNGFKGADLVHQPNIQVTYIEAAQGAGHGFHDHDDLDEILILLEGRAVFTLGEEEIQAQDGTTVLAPRGLPHKVSYQAPGRVLRIKVPSTGERG